MKERISYESVKRKIEADGCYSLMSASAELLFRKTVCPLIYRNIIQQKYQISEPEIQRFNTYYIDKNGHELNQSVGIGKPFVSNIGEGYLLTGSGLILSADRKIVNNHFLPSDWISYRLVQMISRQIFKSSFTPISLNNQATLLKESIAPLYPIYPNYFHWTAETLPQMRYLQKYEEKNNKKIKYMIPKNPPSWVNESLELMNIDSQKIVQASSEAYYSPNLIVPSFVSYSNRDYQWVKNIMMKNTVNNSAKKDNNIYISRSNAISRRVVNENEVMNMLSKYGFDKYHLEDFSVRENIKRFNDADVVIGPHGAGLTDIIFCENATIVELYGKKITDSYRVLADACNQTYMRFECESNGPDIHVDVNRLERILQHRVLD